MASWIIFPTSLFTAKAKLPIFVSYLGELLRVTGLAHNATQISKTRSSTACSSFSYTPTNPAGLTSFPPSRVSSELHLPPVRPHPRLIRQQPTCSCVCFMKSALNFLTLHFDLTNPSLASPRMPNSAMLFELATHPQSHLAFFKPSENLKKLYQTVQRAL